ncbi:hypothetical protein LRS74_24215 [Streptomyces sp. LX-29]|uniref:prenyltransferase/squalene oxidase repeat-containing protein n=1 Tax=Streptomyces sp. LX-29 TaxID=2900152 RepID=UPI00240DF25C|nr:prenyltransferase/squalene oxidase repeat-containing protein [Streptomyces sp. LX-29]WFB09805.1 hypothetical protein LRS74_24215 [Streptomyces sp. LX-29]
MNVRRSAAALAVSAVLGAAAAPAAFADSPKPAPKESSLPRGLYGTTDPTFDGVWRQSLALLAQHAVGVTPADAAVDWLAGQQCADGGFPAFRHETATPCDAKKGEFTDATAAAVQALAAVGGRRAVVEKGVGWLKKHQNADGGWGMNPGGPSDANSTSAAIGALAAVGQDPAKTVSKKGGKSPYAALLALQLGCEAKAGERGAFAYLPDKGALRPNALATAAGALAAEGEGFVVTPAGKGDKAEDEPVEPLDCQGADQGVKDDEDGAREPGDAAEAASAYLAATLEKNGDHLPSSMPGQEKQADFGGTADAVVALSAGEHRTAAAGPMRWLENKDNGAVTWAKDKPGALAKLILAAHAAGIDPRDFGGTDLVRQLNATGLKPAADGDHSDATRDGEEKKDDEGGISLWWVVGIGLIAGVGIGFLLSGRKKQQF